MYLHCIYYNNFFISEFHKYKSAFINGCTIGRNLLSLYHAWKILIQFGDCVKLYFINKFFIIVFFYIFVFASFSGHIEEGPRSERLFETFKAYNQSAVNELDYFAANFFPEKPRYSLLWNRFKNGALQDNERDELLKMGVARFFEHYASQTNIIKKWKNDYGYGPAKPMRQQHIEKLLRFVFIFRTSPILGVWNNYKSFNFDDRILALTKIIPPRQMEEIIFDEITILHSNMGYFGDLNLFIDESYFIKKLDNHCPTLISRLKNYKAVIWGTAEFKFTQATGDTWLARHVANVINSVEDGIIHYAHLERDQLDAFHKKIMESFTRDADYQNNLLHELPEQYYKYKNFTLSLMGFRALFGQVYYGKLHWDTNAAIDKAQRELLELLPKQIDLDTYLQFANDYPCKEIETNKARSLLAGLLDAWHQKSPQHIKKDLINPVPQASTLSLEKTADDEDEEVYAKNVIQKYYQHHKKFCIEFWHEFVSLCGHDWEKAKDKFKGLVARNAAPLASLRALTQNINVEFNEYLPEAVYRGFYLHNNPDGFFDLWEIYLTALDSSEQFRAFAENILAQKSAMEINNIIIDFATMFKTISFDESWEHHFFQLSFLKIRLKPQIPLKESSFEKELRESLMGKMLNEEILRAIKNRQSLLLQVQDSRETKITESVEEVSGTIQEETKETSANVDINQLPPIEADKVMSRFKDKLLREFKLEISKTSDKRRDKLTAHNMLAILESLTSHLGFFGHPHFNEAQSLTPNYKIFKESWRIGSQQSFLYNISHLPQQERDILLSLFQDIQSLYTNVLWNARDCVILLNQVNSRKNSFKAIEQLTRANNEYFSKMLDDKFSSISQFYPLSKVKLDTVINIISESRAEKDCFFEHHLLSCEQLHVYLLYVKDMLSDLNQMYYGARNTLKG